MKNIQALIPVCLLIAALPLSADASPDHFIYDADVELFDDFDSDGHYHFLSVRIDADTLRSQAYVYAVLYLSRDGVNWEAYHTTEDFLIEGETDNDEFFVETELVNGYPTGFYDLLIELYDADFGSYSDEFGPNESEGLALLPLEDATQDPRNVELTVIEGGGGSFSWVWLPALLAAGLGGRTVTPALARLRTMRSWSS